jgi:hypothetical protein
MTACVWKICLRQRDSSLPRRHGTSFSRSMVKDVSINGFPHDCARLRPRRTSLAGRIMAVGPSVFSIGEGK